MKNILYNLLQRQKAELLQYVNKEKVPRSRLKDLQKALFSPLVKVITGPRRCGKSTLARLAIQMQKFAYLNLEDEALPPNVTGDEIMNALAKVYGKVDLYFFDEIQNLPRWEQFIHRLHREEKNCLITGSNAHLLSQELATALTGRHIAIELLPFSYEEFLSAGHEDTEEAFLNYLATGGFPEVVLAHAEAEVYLTTLWDSVIFKDIVRRRKIRQTAELNHLYALMIQSFTARFSNDSLVRSLGRSISAPTVKKFLTYGREAYLIAELEAFHFGARKRIKSDRKAYLYDNGFIKAKGVRFSADYGKLLENLVFIELVRRGYKPNKDMFYYATESKYEVDFLLRQNEKNHELIQVCWFMQEQKTKQREIRSLTQAAEQLSVRHLTILTLNQTERIHNAGVDINVRPIREWLRHSNHS